MGGPWASHFIRCLKTLIPKLIGSRFKVQARPGAIELKYIETYAKFLNMTLYSMTVQNQVWARGSKVITN